MKKLIFLRIVSSLLIISALLLLLLPQFNYMRINNRIQKNIVAAEEIPIEEMQDNLQSETTFDFDSIEEISTTGTWLSPEFIDQNLMIGRLYIPSIKANLTVFNGVSNAILHAGVGTMRSDLTFGEGNIPIAGHYAKDKSTLFGNLIAVEIGDKIYLTDNETVYEYEVYETRTVEVTEVEWIEDNISKKHGKPIISLMNCYYVDGQNTGDRYFVFGELISTSTLADSVLNTN